MAFVLLEIAGEDLSRCWSRARLTEGLLVRLGEYEAAAFLALRELEIRIRAFANLPDLLGVNLMKQAFKKDGAPHRSRPGRRRTRGDDGPLLGRHRRVQEPLKSSGGQLRRPDSRAEAVLLADLLLRLLDAMAAKVADRKVERAAREGRERRKTSLDARQ